MRPPNEITTYLRERFQREYAAWARGGGSWPMRIGLRPPTQQERSVGPIACHAWADEWRAYPGPGTVEYANVRFPTGTHPMPKTLVLDHPREVAKAHPDSWRVWQRCGRRLTALQRAFPRARLTDIIRRVTDLDERDYERLVDAVSWLQSHPTSGMLLRQLPVEGIDTKWLSSHAQLVLALLGDDDGDETPAAATGNGAGQPLPAPRRRRLHERLGLRVPPDLVQVAVLDPAIRDQVAGMRHFAASIDDLNQWRQIPDTVVILENKETGYPITDDCPGVVVLHGQGFSVAHYARISWVRTATKVIYWGDIDTSGLQFVNDLRAYGITIKSILMDKATLDRFRHLSVDGAGAQRKTLPYLTDTEQALYAHLVDYAAKHETGLLLEQERIPWPYAYQVLAAEINDDLPPRVSWDSSRARR